MPEILDLRGRLKSVTAIGEFSQIGFTMVGLGEPRTVRAGVVDGSYFEVMGLRPVLGRLLDKRDDGPGGGSGRAYLPLLDERVEERSGRPRQNDSSRHAVGEIVGVLEPSVPYPAETEIIANVVTSPHHLSATMVTGREHRMTELFAPSGARSGRGIGASRVARGSRRDPEGTSRSLSAEERFPD